MAKNSGMAATVANRAIRSRIVANNSLGTATSASWKITYVECRVTFAPILMSFSHRAVKLATGVWHDRMANSLYLLTYPVRGRDDERGHPGRPVFSPGV